MKVKELLNLIWNEFIYGSHFISLAGVSTIVIIANLLNIETSWIILILTYLLLQVGFYYNRYREFKEDFLTNPERTRHIEKYITYLPIIISIYTLIFIFLLVSFGKIGGILFGLFGVINIFLYSITAKKITEKIIIFKEFYFAVAWTLLPILLFLFFGLPLNLPLVVLLIFVFLRIFLGTTFFDIKDIESDKQKRLLTLPVILGKEKTYFFLRLLSIFAVMPIIIAVYFKYIPLYSLILILTIPYTFYYLNEAQFKKTSHIFLHYFLIGGEFNFYLIFILLGKLLF